MSRTLHNLEKIKSVRLIFSIIMTIASSFLQVFVIQTFMNPCNLLSSGFTGVALLINKITALFGITFSVSIGILLLNLPAALLAYKSVSKRFTFLSCLQFGLTSLLLKIVNFQPMFNDLTLNVLFGGFLYGLSILLALKADGSTGGTDFIALYVSDKIHKSIWDYVFVFNCIVIVIFGFIFGWSHAGWSIIFQFISTRTIDSFYQRYAQVTIEITTDDPEPITRTYIDHFKHGMSVIRAYGAYSHKPVYICKTVISTYEEADVVDCIRSVKPNAIINSYKTNHFYGRFYQKPIE